MFRGSSVAPGVALPQTEPYAAKVQVRVPELDRLVTALLNYSRAHSGCWIRSFEYSSTWKTEPFVIKEEVCLTAQQFIVCNWAAQAKTKTTAVIGDYRCERHYAVVVT